MLGFSLQCGGGSIFNPNRISRVPTVSKLQKEHKVNIFEEFVNFGNKIHGPGCLPWPFQALWLDDKTKLTLKSAHELIGTWEVNGCYIVFYGEGKCRGIKYRAADCSQAIEITLKLIKDTDN
jgi:hypothetical protein